MFSSLEKVDSAVRGWYGTFPNGRATCPVNVLIRNPTFPDEQVFSEVDHCTSKNLVKVLGGPRCVPSQMGGEIPSNSMDKWYERRLKFEGFWNECRHFYRHLQAQPILLKCFVKEVRSIQVRRVKIRIV